MKKSTLNWMLAALLMVSIIGSSAVRKGNDVKPDLDPTNYYWYDASMTYLNRQNTITNECNLTGFNENSSGGTLQEYGYAPSHVQPTPYPPTPSGFADKLLYSHP